MSGSFKLLLKNVCWPAPCFVRLSGARPLIFSFIKFGDKLFLVDHKLSGLRQEAFLLQPVDLRLSITPDHVGFIVLEVPGDNDYDVTFAYPYPFLDLAWYPAHPRNTIRAVHYEPVCAQHICNCTEEFTIPLIGGSYPRDLLSLCGLAPVWLIQFITTCFLVMMS